MYVSLYLSIFLSICISIYLHLFSILVHDGKYANNCVAILVRRERLNIPLLELRLILSIAGRGYLTPCIISAGRI